MTMTAELPPTPSGYEESSATASPQLPPTPAGYEESTLPPTPGGYEEKRSAGPVTPEAWLNQRMQQGVTSGDQLRTVLSEYQRRGGNLTSPDYVGQQNADDAKAAKSNQDVLDDERNNFQQPESDAEKWIREAFSRPDPNPIGSDQGPLEAQANALANSYTKSVLNIGRGVGLDKVLGGIASGRDIDLSAPIDPERNTAVARAVGGAAPIVGASLINPLAGAAVGGAQGVGSGREEGEEMGYTGGQTATLAATRGIAGAVLGLLPGGAAAPEANLAKEFATTALKAQGINIGQAALESEVKNAVGVKDQDTWRAVKDAATSGEGWAQALIIGGAHTVATKYAPAPETPKGAVNEPAAPVQSPSPAPAEATPSAAPNAAVSPGVAPAPTLNPLAQHIADLDTMQARADALLRQKAAVPGALESPVGKLPNETPATPAPADPKAELASRIPDGSVVHATSLSALESIGRDGLQPGKTYEQGGSSDADVVYGSKVKNGDLGLAGAKASLPDSAVLVLKPGTAGDEVGAGNITLHSKNGLGGRASYVKPGDVERVVIPGQPDMSLAEAVAFAKKNGGEAGAGGDKTGRYELSAENSLPEAFRGGAAEESTSKASPTPGEATRAVSGSPTPVDSANLGTVSGLDLAKAPAEEPVAVSEGPGSAGRRPIQIREDELGPRDDIHSLKKAAIDYANKNLVGKTFVNRETGTPITVTKSARDKITFGRTYADRLQGVAAIPQMIEEGTYLGSEPDREGRNTVKAIHRYGAEVQIGDRLRQAVMVVRETPDGHLYYDHHFFEKGEPAASVKEGDEAARKTVPTGSSPITMPPESTEGKENAGPGAASENDPNFSKRPPTLAEQRADAMGERAGVRAGQKLGAAKEQNRQTTQEEGNTTVPLSDAIKARMKAEQRAFTQGQKAEQVQQQVTEGLEEKRIPISDAIKASMTIRAQGEAAIAKLKGKAELTQDVKDQLTESAKSLPSSIRGQFTTDIRDAKTTTDLYRSLKSMDEATTAYNHKSAVGDMFDRIGKPEKAAQSGVDRTLQKQINESVGVAKPEKPFARSVEPEKMRPEFKDAVSPIVDSLRKEGTAKGAASLSDFIQQQTDEGRSNAFNDADIARIKGLEGKKLTDMSADDVKLLDNAMRHTQHLSDNANKMNFAGKQHDREQVKEQIIGDIRVTNPEELKTSAVGKMLGHAPSNGEKGLIQRAFGQAQRDGLRTLSLAGGGEEGPLAKIGYFDLADGETKALGLKQDAANDLKAVQEQHDVSAPDLVKMSTKTEKVDLGNGRSLDMTPMEKMSFANHWTDADTQAEMTKAGMILKRFKGNILLKTPVTPDVADAIIGSMTPFEREYAKAMKDYVNGPLRDAGNKASVDNDGFERLTSTDHWSRSRDDAAQQKNVSMDQKGFYRSWLENLGMLKAREGSKSPVVVGNVLDEFNRNVDGISRYAHLSGPVRNMLMLMGDPELGQEMRTRLGQKWSDAVTRRLEAVSGVGGSDSALLPIANKIRSAIATASLGFRPTSIIKHLLGGSLAAADFDGSSELSKYAAEVANPVNMFDGTTKREMMESSPYFRDRWERSGAELESPTATTDSEHLAKTVPGQRFKQLQDLSMKGLTWGDARDGVQIYKAWQEVYRGEHPNATDAEAQAWAIKKAEYTVRKTGTTSSPLDESNVALALQNVPFANFATLFSSKVNKIHNVADEAIQTFRQNPTRGNAASLGKAAMLVAFSAATAATTAYLFNRLRNGFQPQTKKEADATKASAAWEGAAELADSATFGGSKAFRLVKGVIDGRPQDADEVTSKVDEAGQAVMKAIAGGERGGLSTHAPAPKRDWRVTAEESAKAIAKTLSLFGAPVDAPEEYAQGVINAAYGPAGDPAKRAKELRDDGKPKGGGMRR